MDIALEEIVIGLIELFKPYIEGIRSVLDIGTGTSLSKKVVRVIYEYESKAKGFDYFRISLV